LPPLRLKLETMNAGEQNSLEIGLEVVPNSRKFGIMGFNPWTNSLRVKVRAKPQKGRANDEITQELEKLFHANLRIIAGEKARKKKLIFTGISREQFERIVIENSKP